MHGFEVVIFTALGLLYVVLGIPLMRRRIAQNPWYGLRVPATFKDEWVWYEANAATGRDFVVLGATQAAIALLLPLLVDPADVRYVVVNVAVTLVGAVTVAAIGWSRANRLLRERSRTTR